MTTPIFPDLARLAIQLASRGLAIRRKTARSTIGIMVVACLLVIAAACSFLAALWVLAENKLGHQMAPIAMGLLFLLLASIMGLAAWIRQRQFRKAQVLAAQREEAVLQLAVAMKDHKGMLLLAALAAGVLAGTAR